MEPIYTLSYLKKEADMIASHWNGSDERYIDGDGELRTEGDAQAARELLAKLEEVEDLISELNI